MIQPGDMHNGRVYLYAHIGYGYSPYTKHLSRVTFIHYADGWDVD